MANQTIPIILTPGTFPPGFSYSTPQEFANALFALAAGSLRADVTFLQFVAFDPTTLGATVIFNTAQQAFKVWSVGAGAYVTVTQIPFVGAVMESFVAADQVQKGWVVLDGRAITAITGLSSAQIANLQALFPSGNLPTVTPMNGNGLPASDTFSGITVPTVAPADGVIAALPIDAVYDELEVEALRDATETLRDSTALVETQAEAIQDGAEALLAALRAPTIPAMVKMVFCGTP